MVAKETALLKQSMSKQNPIMAEGGVQCALEVVSRMLAIM